MQIKAISYEEARLAFFKGKRDTAQKRLDKLARTVDENEPYLSELRERLDDAGSELSYYNDVIEMLGKAFEVEKLQKQLDDKCDRCIVKDKAAGAKELAEKIRLEIAAATRSNERAIAEREKQGANRYEDNFCAMCDGKIAALRGIDYYIDSLIEEMEGKK